MTAPFETLIHHIPIAQRPGRHDLFRQFLALKGIAGKVLCLLTGHTQIGNGRMAAPCQNQT